MRGIPLYETLRVYGDEEKAIKRGHATVEKRMREFEALFLTANGDLESHTFQAFDKSNARAVARAMASANEWEPLLESIEPAIGQP